MKTPIQKARLLVAALVVSIAPLQAQSLDKNALAFAKTWQDRYNKGDKAALMALYADKITFVNPRDNSESVGSKSDVEADFTRDFSEAAGTYVDMQVTATETLSGGKMKMAGTFTGYDFDRKTNTKLNPAGGTYENMLVKENGQWKLYQLKTVWNIGIIRRELAAMTRQFQDAYNKEDHAALKTMLADDMVRTDAQGAVITGAAAVTDSYKNLFAASNAVAVITQANVVEQFDGKVTATGTYRINGISEKGDRIALAGSYANTCVKENGAWKITGMKLAGLVKTVVYHKVADMAKWKALFDGFRRQRLDAGELSVEVGTFYGEPNTVYVINEWASATAAQAFFSNAELAATMQKAGVLEKPTLLVLDKKAD